MIETPGFPLDRLERYLGIDRLSVQTAKRSVERSLRRIESSSETLERGLTVLARAEQALAASARHRRAS